MKFLISLVFLMFVSVHASADRFNKVVDDDVLLNLRHEATLETLPMQMTLVSWNVEKAKQKEKWRQDFLSLTEKADLFLLQEGMADDYLPQALKESTLGEWWMAQAWRDSKGFTTGVITGSKSKSITQNFLRSPDSEPIANTPKMTLAQTFTLASGQTFLLINVHGINFVLNKSFEKQMIEILKMIDSGLEANPEMKVVFAGDMNTWNAGRMNFIANELNKRGFAHVGFQQDRRNLKLDHVFVKGCSIETAVLHSKIKTSDHAPVEVSLDCAKPTGVGFAVDATHRL